MVRVSERHFTVAEVRAVVEVAVGEVEIGKFLFQKVSDGHRELLAYQAPSLVQVPPGKESQLDEYYRVLQVVVDAIAAQMTV
jgi:hypothetical protein